MEGRVFRVRIQSVSPERDPPLDYNERTQSINHATSCSILLEKASHLEIDTNQLGLDYSVHNPILLGNSSLYAVVYPRKIFAR